jgi:hypothetical protein
MNGMHVGSSYGWGQISGSSEYDFPPRYCLAYGNVAASGFGPGNAGCVIQGYRQRQADGSDVPTNFSGDYWDSPQAIGVDQCTSVTFSVWIQAGGYVVSSEVLTFW